MTPSSIPPLSGATPAPVTSETQHTAEKRQHLALSSIPEDRVELSAKFQAKLLKQQPTSQQSDSGGKSQSAKVHGASLSPSHTDKLKLSPSAQAKLLQSQGDKIPQIANALEVSTTTVEDYLGLTTASGADSMITSKVTKTSTANPQPRPVGPTDHYNLQRS